MVAHTVRGAIDTYRQLNRSFFTDLMTLVGLHEGYTACKSSATTISRVYIWEPGKAGGI